MTDILRAADGEADTVDCGTEADTAVVDAGGLDTLTDCETLDQTPETTITDSPRSRTRSRRAKFEFEADEPATFECKLDSGDFEECESGITFNGLSRSRHKFQVLATDLIGNKEIKAAKFRWKVIP